MMDAVFIKEETFDSDASIESDASNSLINEEDPLGESQTKTESAQDKLYHCKICGKGYNLRGSLRYHTRTHSRSAEKHQCANCGKEYATALHLKNHQFYMHSDPETWPHQCELCPKKFPIKSKLDAHLLQHTNTKPFSCESCGKSFYTKTELRKHGRKHSDLREFECELCPKSFKSNEARLHHKARFHVKNSEFYCVVCKLEFDSGAEFEEHVKVDKGNDCQEFKFDCTQIQKHEKVYKCDQCSRSFNTCKNLFSHKKRSHDPASRKHFCETCHKKFSNRKLLKQHKKNFKPYVCEICNVKFEHDCNVISHYATHGSKPEFDCTQCNKKCKTRGGLQRHLRISHSVKCKEENVSDDIDEEYNELKL